MHYPSPGGVHCQLFELPLVHALRPGPVYDSPLVDVSGRGLALCGSSKFLLLSPEGTKQTNQGAKAQV